MLVKDLIAKLLEYDQDATVVIPGYENGYDDIDRIISDLLIKNTSTDYWDGAYIETKIIPHETDKLIHAIKLCPTQIKSRR